MTRRLIATLLVLAGFLAASRAMAGPDVPGLTDGERAWLQAHPTIRLGDDFTWPPFVFMDDKGVYSGLSSGYVAWLSGRLGIDIRPVRGLRWAEVLDKVKSGGVDLLPAVVRSPEREAFLNFTKPYISFPVVIATRPHGIPAIDLTDLARRNVGVVKGYFTHETLAKDYPAIHLVPFDTLAAGLEALDAGRIDAVVDNLGAVTYEIRRLRLAHVKVAATTPYQFELSMAVRKDWPELRDALDKALDAMPSHEKSAIENTWLAIEVHLGIDSDVLLRWGLPVGALVVGIIVVIGVWNRRLRQEIRVRERISGELLATGGRLKLVLETAAEGIVGLDTQGRTILANPAAAAILGWPSVEAMIGRNKGETLGHVLAAGSPCSAATCPIQAAVTGGQSHRAVDEFFTGRNGALIPVEYVASPLPAAGETPGTVVVFHDISERKALEAELKRSNAELQLFAYAASHDMREPLRMIASYLSLLERRLGDGLDRDCRDFLGFAKDGARRMDRLILGLLDYSRIGRDTGAKEPVALTAVVAEAVDNLAMAIGDCGGHVEVREPMPEVPGSRIDLVRVFQNLIANAIKYRAPDRVPVVTISARRIESSWQVSVADNGVGIAPEHQERIFGIFQRLHGADVEGCGIGLASCRKIVEQHHGRIWVESLPGQGSTFHFTLPAAG